MTDHSSAGSGNSAVGTLPDDFADMKDALDIQSEHLADLEEHMPAAHQLHSDALGLASPGQVRSAAGPDLRDIHDQHPAWPRRSGMGFYGGPGPPVASASGGRPRVARWEGPFMFRQSRGPLSEDYLVHREELGRGECSVLWKCESRRTGQLYACKSIPKAVLTPGFDVTVSLGTEIEVLSLLLGHPNIVEQAGIYEDGTAVHVVMELCGGGALSDLIRGARAFREVEAAWLFRKIVAAIHFCHDRTPAIVHRNIAPHNILLSTRAIVEPKLSGFGRAAILAGGQLTTGLAGSPEYMAPEMVCGAAYGTAADIWSLGVLLFNMLSGALPFTGPSPVQVFAAVLEGQLQFDSQPWPGVSNPVKLLIRQMLAHDPRNRPTTRHLLLHPWLTSFGAVGSAPPAATGPVSPASPSFGAQGPLLSRQYAHLPSAYSAGLQAPSALSPAYMLPAQFPARSSAGMMMPGQQLGFPYVPVAPAQAWPEASTSTSSSSFSRAWPQSSQQSLGGRSLSGSSTQSTHFSPPLLSPLTLATSAPLRENGSARWESSYPAAQPSTLQTSPLPVPAQLPSAVAESPLQAISFPFPAHHPTLAEPGQPSSLDAFPLGAYHASLDRASEAQLETPRLGDMPVSIHPFQMISKAVVSSMSPSTAAAAPEASASSPAPRRSLSASGTSGLTAEALSSPIGPMPVLPFKVDEAGQEIAERDTTYDFLIDDTLGRSLP